jgi:hypothetical protein
VFPKGHALSSRHSLSPREVLKERLISFDRDTPQGRIIADWCARSKMEPSSSLEVRSGQMASALAACGAGIAIHVHPHRSLSRHCSPRYEIVVVRLFLLRYLNVSIIIRGSHMGIVEGAVLQQRGQSARPCARQLASGYASSCRRCFSPLQTRPPPLCPRRIHLIFAVMRGSSSASFSTARAAGIRAATARVGAGSSKPVPGLAPPA